MQNHSAPALKPRLNASNLLKPHETVLNDVPTFTQLYSTLLPEVPKNRP